MSLPSRERGLKYCHKTLPTLSDRVAPLAGAWIEILSKTKSIEELDRRSPRGSVD